MEKMATVQRRGKGWLGLLILAVVLAGCGGATPTSAPSPTSSPSPTVALATPIASPTTSSSTPTSTTVPPASPTMPPTPAATPSVTAALPSLTITPLQTRGLQYGFNVFLAGNADGAELNSRTMAKVQEAGFGWVRVQLQWSELEPTPGNYNTAPYDYIIGAAAKAGAQVLVSVVKAPAWAAPSRPGALPEDTAAFQRTMRYLAARYNGQVQAWEIWNEENLAGEVGGHVDVAPYVAALKAGYSGVKAADPAAFVLFGGLTPTGLDDPAIAVNDVDYLRAFYQYNGGEGRNYFDALAAHPGSAANPPDTKYPDQPGSGACPQQFVAQAGTCWKNGPEFYFRRVEDQRAVMAQYGDGVKQVWLTEFGWDACPDLPAPKGYEYCSLTNEAQQAAYIQAAFQYAQAHWPWLGATFIWNLNYAATPNIRTDDEKYGWSLLRGDWSERPAFQVVKALPK
jgi:polysaccharide biosynthesis protein PslG